MNPFKILWSYSTSPFDGIDRQKERKRLLRLANKGKLTFPEKARLQAIEKELRKQA